MDFAEKNLDLKVKTMEKMEMKVKEVPAKMNVMKEQRNVAAKQVFKLVVITILIVVLSGDLLKLAEHKFVKMVIVLRRNLAH